MAVVDIIFVRERRRGKRVVVLGRKRRGGDMMDDGWRRMFKGMILELIDGEDVHSSLNLIFEYSRPQNSLQEQRAWMIRGRSRARQCPVSHVTCLLIMLPLMSASYILWNLISVTDKRPFPSPCTVHFSLSFPPDVPHRFLILFAHPHSLHHPHRFVS